MRFAGAGNYAKVGRNEIVIAPIESEEMLASAYHELAHLMTFDPTARRVGHVSPANELTAWAWAKEQLGAAWTDRMFLHARRCLHTYVHYANAEERVLFLSEWEVSAPRGCEELV